jgi:hypothetical protein
MSDEQVSRLEEVLAAYRYIQMRMEFFEAFLAWMCLSNLPGFSTSDNDLQLAHSSLYTGLWVETQPSEEGWPVAIFMSKGSQVVN